MTLAGVCGWPIHHSLSPVLHNFWLRELGISGAYVHFAVHPLEAVEAFKSLKNTSITGVNVTIPLKKLAFQAADEHTPDALKLGVANCLYKRDGKLVAHNTDMEGFAAPLLAKLGPKTIMKSAAVIIGTGGASRAVIGALIAMGVPEIRICGRTEEKAEQIISDISLPNVHRLPWANRTIGLKGAGLIINSSAGGMAGKAALDLDLTYTEKTACVYDLVYTPLKTPLLRNAERKGLQTIGGLDMLIAQARPAFKLFYKAEPSDDLDPKPVLLKALKG